MRAANVPYTIIGGMRFYERAEVKDLLAYLRLMLNPNDDTSLLRVVNTPSRKIGKTTTDRLATYATARQTTIWKLIASGDYPDDVGGAARKALTGFYTLVGDLRKKANAMLERPSEIAQEVFNRTGYKVMLDDPTDHDNESRRENVAELIGSMKDYEAHEREPSLQEYLERVSLSEETASAEGGEKVSLMSVHAAKGLEFQVVFLAGMEDGMFPYKGVNAGDDPDEMEEERRLARRVAAHLARMLGVVAADAVDPARRAQPWWSRTRASGRSSARRRSARRAVSSRKSPPTCCPSPSRAEVRGTRPRRRDDPA
jgi:DNA helicase-2/ATP-dependent DNA helicase PcrA